MDTGQQCYHVALETLFELAVLGRRGRVQHRWVRCLLCSAALHQELREQQWVTLAVGWDVGPVEEALHTGACLGCGRPLESNRKRYCSPQCARHSAYVRNRKAILLRRRERYWRRKREKGPQ